MWAHTLEGQAKANGDEGFAMFLERHERPLRRALVARYGPEVGTEAAADAVATAWANRERVLVMKNPLGYLYRVGQSSTRRHFRWRRSWPGSLPPSGPILDSDAVLDVTRALSSLSTNERVAVLMVHAYGWSYAEVALLLDSTESRVTNYVSRGLRHLRSKLGATYG
jgi:DNA-directed RNA polymerase specialized sigma24 family protein